MLLVRLTAVACYGINFKASLLLPLISVLAVPEIFETGAKHMQRSL